MDISPFELCLSAGRWAGKGDVFEDPWIEPGTADLQQRLLVSVLAERRRATAAADCPQSPIYISISTQRIYIYIYTKNTRIFKPHPDLFSDFQFI